MKRRELERRLMELGWKILRHGRKHEVWASPDDQSKVYVPRHRDVSERLAREILRRAGSRES